MTRNTLNRQLQTGIIDQARYDRMMDIIENDEKTDGTKRKTNTAYIEGLIRTGLINNSKQ
jgi:uncharacterized membrane protein